MTILVGCSNTSQQPRGPSISTSWAMFGFDPQHTRFNPYEHILSPMNVSSLIPYWTASFKDNLSDKLIVGNGIVYTTTSSTPLGEDILHALDAKTGKELWAYAAATGDPTVINGVIYLVEYIDVGGRRKLYALDAKTGKPIWNVPIDQPVGYDLPICVCDLLEDAGIVYDLNYKTLYEFNAKTGARLLTIPLEFGKDALVSELVIS